MNRRERERQQLRSRILETARQIIAADGYDALTIRKIAERIEYSPMALYNHFPDKSAILLALARETFVDLEKRLPMPGKRPLNSLRKGLLAYIEFGLEHPDAYRVTFMHPLVKKQPEVGAVQSAIPEDAGGRRAFEILIANVQACIDAAIFHGAAMQLAAVLWAGIHGVVSLQLAQPDFPFGSSKAFAELTVDTLIRGLEGKP